MAISGGSRSRLRALSWSRSEEHTSELQSQSNLVCRLLLEKKKKHRSSHSQSILPYSSILCLPAVSSLPPRSIPSPYPSTRKPYTTDLILANLCTHYHLFTR